MREQHPLRDRLVGLHMLALARAGRHAEATRVFQGHRRRFVDELGLEPSAQLVELDRRIVDGDPSLHLSSVAGRALRGYRLGEQLGEGAFAVVYRGTQPSVGRDVAVKIIRSELANRPEFIRRFEAEAHLVARLEHPHIVPLYDYWREPDRACLVFRYLRGGSLEARLTSTGRLSAEEAVRMVEQVGAALMTAHRAGVVHRDVKPANIFLDEDGNFYLGDFGIALAAAELDDPDASLSAGSPAYASPEQLRRQPIGPPADVHALAITAFEALTVRLPFPNAVSHADLLQRQLQDPIPSVTALRPDLPPTVGDVLAVATAKDPSDRHQTMEAFVAEFVESARPSSVSNSVPARRGVSTAVSSIEPRNPYKGLKPFTEADSADFRGRERLVDRMVEMFGRTDSSGRVVAVVGPSGIGKSSVVKAGLLPALRRGAAQGSDAWFVASMMPGGLPFDELAAALIRVASEVPDNLMAILDQDHRGLNRVVKAIVPQDSGAELLLVIDQFEELFTLTSDEQARQRFLEAIRYAVTDPRCPLRVVLTMRADFWDRPLRHGAFARLIESSVVNVTALAPDELERAVVEPAMATGCEFEPGLLSEIVADVADEPGALPLLQYALTELWERRISGLLTVDTYRGLGGVTGALARRAEELYAELGEVEQLTVRQLFGRLVTLADDAGPTRRRVRRSELATLDGLDRVIDRFGRARLLSFDRDPGSREPTVEVAHEAILREWPRLKEWLDQDGEALRLLRHLSTTATEWHRAGRPDSELYRGDRLEAAVDFARSEPSGLTVDERAFVDAGLAAAEAQEAEERDRFERQLRSNRRLRVLLAGLGVLLVMAVLSGGLAAVQRSRADAERTRAEGNARLAEENELLAIGAASRAEQAATRAEEIALVADVQRLTTESRLALDVDPDLAILLALEAHDLGQSLDEVPGSVVSALQTATQESRLRVRLTTGGRWMGLRDDGEVIATADPVDPSVVVLQDTESGEEIDRLNAPRPVGDAAFHPDGSLLVTFLDEGGPTDVPRLSGQLYDSRLEPVSELPGPCCISEPEFSPDGQFLKAMLGGPGALQAAIWDLGRPADGPTMLLDGRWGQGWTSTGGALMYTRSNVFVVNPETAQVAPFGLPDFDNLISASPSPTEDRIVIESEGPLQVWRSGAASPDAEINLSLAGFVTPTFTPDGQGLHIFGLDDEVRVMDIASREVVGLRGHPSGIVRVMTSLDGLTLAAATLSGDVLVWDLSPTGPAALGNLDTSGFIGAIELEPSGDSALVVESSAGATQVLQFDLATQSVSATSSSFPDVGSFIAATAATEALVVGGPTPDGSGVIENLLSGEPLLALRPCERPFSTDDKGRWVLAVVEDLSCGEGMARVVDLASGEELLSWDGVNPMGDFGPSGTIAEGLIAVQLLPGLEVRRVADGETVAVFDDAYAFRPFFSPDGRLITFGSPVSGGWALDVERMLEGFSGADVVALNKNVVGGPTTFTVANDRYLVTGHSGELLRFWHLDTGEEWLTLPVDTGASTMLAPTADGDYLYYAGRGGVVRRFPLEDDELADLARQRVQRDFTAEECSRFGIERCAVNP